MVDGCTWFTFTPPEVTIASATGLGPVTDTVKPFSSSSRARRWALVTELAFSPAGISSRSSITGTMLWGTRPASIFSKSRLGFSPRSRRMRASSFSRSSAGFRSMDRRYCSRSQCRRWALADSTRGPDTPKWVNSSSPKSRNCTLFFPFRAVSSTFFRARPCIRRQASSPLTRGTREPQGGTISWPRAAAMRYPSPVEPVAG